MSMDWELRINAVFKGLVPSYSYYDCVKTHFVTWLWIEFRWGRE
jgi:hypothetical protein